MIIQYVGEVSITPQKITSKFPTNLFSRSCQIVIKQRDISQTINTETQFSKFITFYTLYKPSFSLKQ